MEYLKALKSAAYFGGIIIGLSLLVNLRIDYLGWIAGFLCFLIVAIHDLGKKYLEMTNQTALVKHFFGMIVNPLLAIIGVSSFFYVCVGEMVWYFWAIAFFVALLMFAYDAVGLAEELKKIKD
jgi:hypothetical protein